MFGLALTLTALSFVNAGIMMSPTNVFATTDVFEQECQTICGLDNNCYIAHPTSCFKYIMCTRNAETGGFDAQVMPCAFGTMWRTTDQGVACAYPTVGGCGQDPCANTLAPASAYKHEDGHCGTYWYCEGGVSVAACCGINERFKNGQCLPDKSCKKACTLTDPCHDPSIVSYQYNEHNCRSFMACDESAKSVTKCCPEFHSYFNGTCVQNATCDAKCFECRYKAVVNAPHKFQTLDSHGGEILDCAVGTIFNATSCQCNVDEAFFARAKLASAGCEMDVHVVLPSLQNRGVAGAAIMRLGNVFHDEHGRGNYTRQWLGDEGINIPFFGSQQLDTFFLEIQFTPTASGSPQILMSSCSYPINGKKGKSDPSLEVELTQSTTSGDVVNVNMINVNGTSGFNAQIPYQVNVPYVFRLIYDGTTAGAFLKPQDPNAVPVDRIQPFSGPIHIQTTGLRFARCRYDVVNKLSFIGLLDEFSLTRCLKPAMTQMLYPTQIP